MLKAIAGNVVRYTNDPVTGRIRYSPVLTPWFSMPAIQRVAMSSPPTVSVAATHGITNGVLAPFTPNGNQQYISAHAAGSWSSINASYWTPSQQKPGTAIRNQGSISFMFDGLVCAVQVTSAPGHKYRVLVDDQVVGDWYGASGPGGGAVRYIVIAFATASVRKIRVDQVYADIAGVVVGPTDSIWAAKIRGPKVLCMGDSYQDGSGQGPTGYNGIASWCWTFAQEMGWDDVGVSSVGGAGWLMNNGGVFSGQNSLSVRAADVVSAVKPDIVILSAGKNDNPTYSAEQVGAAAASVYSAIKTAVPNGIVVIAGPTFPGASVTRGIADATWTPYQSAIFAGCAGADLLIDTCSEGFFTGTGKAGATTGSGNGDIYIQADGTHPNQAGADYLGSRFAAAVKRAATKKYGI